MAKLPINDAVNFGWQTTLKNKRFLIGVTVLTFLIQSIFNYGSDSLNKQLDYTNPYSLAGDSLIGWIIDGVLSLGLIKIALDFVDHGHAKFRDLWWVLRKPGKLISYIGATLIYGIIVGVWVVIIFGTLLGFEISNAVVGPGLSNYLPLLFLIPVVWLMGYFAIKYCFYTYRIADAHDSALHSLGHSAELTKGVKFQLLLFGLTLAGVNVLGALALIVGLLFTIPTTMLAAAYIYRYLSPK